VDDATPVQLVGSSGEWRRAGWSPELEERERERERDMQLEREVELGGSGL
jgi:hypothetical protein